MPASPTITGGKAQALSKFSEAALRSISENLGSLIDKPVELKAVAPSLLDVESFSLDMSGDFVVLSGDLEKDYKGAILLLFGLEEAITFASYMMMIPDDVVIQHRKTRTFGEEDQETFGEVGNIIFSALDEVLRSKVPGKVNIRLKDQSQCKLPGDVPESFSSEPYILCSFSCKIADFPEAEGAFLIPLEAAEKINREPLFGKEEDESGSAADIDELEGLPEDAFEEIPEATIQGGLVTYVQDDGLFKKVRKSCRRVGLELEKRPKTEVPNPSTHAGKIVLIEVGRGEIKRFDWCRRLKESGEVQVAIMLMEPTEYTVVMAYQAGADVITGWPIHESRLSAKLARLFEEESKSEEEPAESE